MMALDDEKHPNPKDSEKKCSKRDNFSTLDTYNLSISQFNKYIAPCPEKAILQNFKYGP